MGRSVSKKGLSKLQHALYGTWIFVLAYLIIGHAIPYSWYVDVKTQDVVQACVESNIIRYHSERTPLWGMKGGTYAEVVKYKDGEVLETIIKRGTLDNLAPWAYEGGTTEATFNTEWSHPFQNVGEYGINSWNTIYPLPFISVTRYTPAEDTKFNVIVCEP